MIEFDLREPDGGEIMVIRLPSREDIARAVHDVQCGCPIDDDSRAAEREHRLPPIQYPKFSHVADAILAMLRLGKQHAFPADLETRLTAALLKESSGGDANSAAWWRELAATRALVSRIYMAAAHVLPVDSLPHRAAIDASVYWKMDARGARDRAASLERRPSS